MLKKISLLAVSLALVACGGPQQVDTDNNASKAVVETQKAGKVQPAVQADVQAIAKPEQAEKQGFTVPEYQRLVLDNGLTVMLMEHHEVPLVSVNFVSKAGYVQDGAQLGLADLTAEALRLGTKQLSKMDIDVALDNMGTDLAVVTSSEATALSLDVMTEDLDASLGLLASLVMEPTFPKDDVVKLRERTVASLQQNKESPRNVIGNYFNALLYAGHPYSQPATGTQHTIAAMGPDNLQTFHRDYFAPQNGALVITGDIQPEQLLEKINRIWLGWRNPQAKPIAPLAKPALPDKAQVLLVDKADAREATFLIGGPGVSLSHPDRVPLHVLNTILGGRFTSWLNDELRVNAGLTYGARSSFVPRKQGGAFLISTFTDAKDAEAGIDLALKTYRRLWEQGLDQATLDSARAYVNGQFPPKYETHAGMADLLADIYAYGMSVEFINQFVSKVNGLTLEGARELVDSHFPKDKLQFVVVGPADQLREMLAKYADVQEVSIEQPGFAITADAVK